VAGMVYMCFPSLLNRFVSVFWVCMVGLLVFMFLSRLHFLVISFTCGKCIGDCMYRLSLCCA
jgi:hypothetical protein